MYRINKIFRFSMFLMIFVAASCGSKPGKSHEELAPVDLSVVQVSIGGMMCTDCEQAIQNSVGKLPGVRTVKASWKEGIAMVEYDPATTDTLKIKEAVNGTGYTVKGFSKP